MAASDYAAGGHFMASGDDGMRPVAMGQDWVERRIRSWTI
jgi:response regulator NasT